MEERHNTFDFVTDSLDLDNNTKLSSSMIIASILNISYEDVSISENSLGEIIEFDQKHIQGKNIALLFKFTQLVIIQMYIQYGIVQITYRYIDTEPI